MLHVREWIKIKLFHPRIAGTYGKACRDSLGNILPILRKKIKMNSNIFTCLLYLILFIYPYLILTIARWGHLNFPPCYRSIKAQKGCITLPKSHSSKQYTKDFHSVCLTTESIFFLLYYPQHNAPESATVFRIHHIYQQVNEWCGNYWHCHAKPSMTSSHDIHDLA